MADADKEWTPEDEVDPVKLQQEQIALGKEFLQRLKNQEKIDAERKAAYEQARAEGPLIAAQTYTPPTFEEISSRIKKCWDELERIMPTAPDAAKVKAFEVLLHGSAMGYGVGPYA